jgi:predicted regulator of Ras-like GTPase activity (Roadblock/LC7/MglB family)
MSQGYEQKLRDLVENLPGAVFASLAGTDGIGISCHQSGLDLDPSLADAEFATMLSASRRAAENLALGLVAEQIVATEQFILLIRMVGPDFYLSLGLRSGNLGMARLLMRRACEEFNKLLY